MTRRSVNSLVAVTEMQKRDYSALHNETGLNSSRSSNQTISRVIPCFNLRQLALSGLAMVSLSLMATPALAHHPFGGNTPGNLFEGFLAGLGHPVIGIDHLAFVIAAGLLAALFNQGLLIPITFVATSMAGTLLHLGGVNLPVPEVIISASVLLAGLMLAIRTQPPSRVGLVLGAIAGIFHGYAYGEAVIGAEVGPIMAYLAGFALVQMAIAFISYRFAYYQMCDRPESIIPALPLRFSGFLLSGVGVTLLFSKFLG